MALVLGTNCGFVTVAPVADPSGSFGWTLDNISYALKDTSPIGAGKITEIGWWCDNSTEAANFDVGIYTHNVGDNNPEAVVGSISADNAKGTTAGWKKVTGLNIAITAGNIYWIAVQLDNTFTATTVDTTNSAGDKQDFKNAQTELPSPWGASDGTAERIMAFYAVWEEGEEGANMQINIGDTWKDVESMQINIGDVWKDVIGVQQNIGDTWKTVF